MREKREEMVGSERDERAEERKQNKRVVSVCTVF